MNNSSTDMFISKRETFRSQNFKILTLRSQDMIIFTKLVSKPLGIPFL